MNIIYITCNKLYVLCLLLIMLVNKNSIVYRTLYRHCICYTFFVDGGVSFV